MQVDLCLLRRAHAGVNEQMFVGGRHRAHQADDLIVQDTWDSDRFLALVLGT